MYSKSSSSIFIVRVHLQILVISTLLIVDLPRASSHRQPPLYSHVTSPQSHTAKSYDGFDFDALESGDITRSLPPPYGTGGSSILKLVAAVSSYSPAYRGYSTYMEVVGGGGDKIVSRVKVLRFMRYLSLKTLLGSTHSFLPRLSCLYTCVRSCTYAVPLVGHAADNRSYPDLEENQYLDDLHHAMEDEIREREIARARLELEVRLVQLAYK